MDRIKLEPVTDQIPSFRADVGANGTRDVQAPQTEEQQITTEVPPWAESYEISSMEMDGESSVYAKQPVFLMHD
jgi:hypothetical protein